VVLDTRHYSDVESARQKGATCRYVSTFIVIISTLEMEVPVNYWDQTLHLYVSTLPLHSCLTFLHAIYSILTILLAMEPLKDPTNIQQFPLC